MLKNAVGKITAVGQATTSAAKPSQKIDKGDKVKVINTLKSGNRTIGKLYNRGTFTVYYDSYDVLGCQKRQSCNRTWQTSNSGGKRRKSHENIKERYIMSFIITHWVDILIVVAFIVGLCLLVKFGYKKQVKEICFYLVNEAEREFGGGTGQLKYATVVTWLYERLPAVLKLFMTAKMIDNLIEDAVKRMQQYLDTNQQARVKIIKD